MTRKISFVLGLVVAAFAVGSAHAEAKTGNCQSMAVALTTSATTRPVTLVREWTTNIVEAFQGELVVKEGWLDGQSGKGSSTNYWGAYWFSTTVEKGKDYVLWLDKGSTGNVILTAEGPTYARMPFQSDVIDGITYYYINAKDWQNYHVDTKYYIRIFGGPNRVGKTAGLNFRQVALKDVMPHDKGSVNDPYDIDVTVPGLSSLYAPPEKQRNRLATVYRASLKANTNYTFEVSYPEGNMGGAALMLPDGVTVDDVPGTISITRVGTDDNALAWSVTVTEDCALTFAVGMWPTDDEDERLDVTGAMLMWTVAGVGPEDPIDPGPEPEVVGTGAYGGTLVAQSPACGLDVTSVVFQVEVSLTDAAVTNFASVLTVGTTELTCKDLANGAVVQGQEPYQSCLELRLAEGGKVVSVYGAVYIDGREYLVDGLITGRMDGTDYAFEEVDALTMSAEEMGITNGAFKAEQAGSDVLVRLQQWGEKYGLMVSCANEAEFSAAGDPLPGNLVATAYLLDCAVDAAAIEEAESAFVITAFDPVNGVTVAGTRSEGDRYGNGTIEIRTSATVDGTYDTSDKPAASQLFYRACLVK